MPIGDNKQLYSQASRSKVWSVGFLLEIEGHETLCSQPKSRLPPPASPQSFSWVLKVVIPYLQLSCEKHDTELAIFSFTVPAKLASRALLFADTDPENTSVYSHLWATTLLGVTVNCFYYCYLHTQSLPRGQALPMLQQILHSSPASPVQWQPDLTCLTQTENAFLLPELPV